MGYVLKATIISFLVSSLSCYSIVDIQNDIDVYETESAKSDDVIYLKTELEPIFDDQSEAAEPELESSSPNILEIIQQKIADLEEANKKLEKDLGRTKAELTKKNNEIKRRRVANVQLETSHQNPQAENKPVKFWDWICAIGKNLVSVVLNFFGVRI